MLKDRGARIFSQDSDGDMTAAIPAFNESVVNLMFPMEPRAGMDIVKLRKQYGGKLAFMASIEKYALLGSKKDIATEL